jgi:hypothetical protein
MHIASTTHEHGSSAKVYTYEGDFDVGDDAITWRARIVCGDDAPRALSGRIPMTSPGLNAVAEEAVRDAIIKRIDRLDDAENT